MKEHTINFSYRARYYVLGDLHSAHTLWFVLHGYGQLAQYFIKKFEVLTRHGMVVVAPEGLSRFYLEDVATRSRGGSQRVGATWMTRENRLADIENYLTYLTTVYREVTAGCALRTTVLGFSQGAATAARWAVSGQVEFDKLILWAGLVPEDMDFDEGQRVLKTKEVIHVYGLEDPFITDERFAHMQQLAQRLHASPRWVPFRGAHDIDGPTLERLAHPR
ncbi:MAG: hypothetical protein MUC38_03920 [Cyclobacteriaceae bacterium]|jgi:predicted esterase|nr:hypothetical protein [Cyclobacteriaceae bacterium]